MRHLSIARSAAWLATAGLLGAALLAPAATLATQHQGDGGGDNQGTNCDNRDDDGGDGYNTEFVVRDGDRDDDDGDGDDNCSTPSPTEQPTEAPTEQPTEAPTDQPTTAPTDQPTEAPTTAPTQEPESTSTPAPTGTVEGATGVPEITPPPTDTFGTATPTSGTGMQLLLLAAAGLLATVLIVTPAASRARR